MGGKLRRFAAAMWLPRRAGLRREPAVRPASTRQAVDSPSARLRPLVMTIAAVVALSLAVSVPHGWSAFQGWRLRRMSIPDLEAVIKRQPANVEAHYALGLTYARA